MDNFRNKLGESATKGAGTPADRPLNPFSETGEADEPLGATGVFHHTKSEDRETSADLKALFSDLTEPPIESRQPEAPILSPKAISPVSTDGLVEPLVHRIVLESSPAKKPEAASVHTRLPIKPDLSSADNQIFKIGSSSQATSSSLSVPSSAPASAIPAVQLDPNAGFTQLLRTLTEKTTFTATEALAEGIENAGSDKNRESVKWTRPLEISEQSGDVHDAGFTSLLHAEREQATPAKPASYVFYKAEAGSIPLASEMNAAWESVPTSQESSGFTALLKNSSGMPSDTSSATDATSVGSRYEPGSLEIESTTSTDKPGHSTQPGELTKLFSTYNEKLGSTEQSSQTGSQTEGLARGGIAGSRPFDSTESSAAFEEGYKRETLGSDEVDLTSSLGLAHTQADAAIFVAEGAGNSPLSSQSQNWFKDVSFAGENAPFDRQTARDAEPKDNYESQATHLSSLSARPVEAAGYESAALGITQLLNRLESSPPDTNSGPKRAGEVDSVTPQNGPATQTWLLRDNVQSHNNFGAENSIAEESEVTRILNASKLRESQRGRGQSAGQGVAEGGSTGAKEHGDFAGQSLLGMQKPIIPQGLAQAEQGMAGFKTVAGANVQAVHGLRPPPAQIQQPEISSLQSPAAPGMGKLQQLMPLLLICAIFLLIVILVTLLFLLKH